MGTQETLDALNQAKTDIAESKANTAVAVEVLVKVKGETQALLAAVAALTDAVNNAGNTVPQAVADAVAEVTAASAGLREATSGVVIAGQEIDALVPDAPQV